MGTDYLPWISAGYALLTGVICAIEAKRIQRSGPDVLSLFMGLFLLQCCLPGIVIFGCLPFTGFDEPTDNPVFDRVFANMDFSSALLVLEMTAWFAVLMYLFMGLGAVVMRRVAPAPPASKWIVLRGSSSRLLIVLSFGLILTLVAFWSMGDTMLDRYSSLIGFRAYSDDVDRSTLVNFAFLLTQAWLWLSIVALFVLLERRHRGLAWYFCVVCALIFVVLSVSRRAVFIPILLVYFTLVLFDGRWRAKFVLAASIPILLCVAFGKEALSAVAFGGSVDDVLGHYQTVAAVYLRAASEMGITLVESIGTINLLHMPPRFGVDHVLSIMRGSPLGWFLHWLGQDRWMPTRIVRLSTEALATSADQDVPPGLIGQMWLDFQLVGPIVWAFGFAVQLCIVQWVFSWAIRTREAIAVIVLVTFVIALPLNTGSYDFSFGDDMVALALCLIFTFRVARVSLPAEGEVAGRQE